MILQGHIGSRGIRKNFIFGMKGVCGFMNKKVGVLTGKYFRKFEEFSVFPDLL